MKVYGRNMLDRETEHQLDGLEIVVSLYRARIDGRIEVRTNDGVIVVLPRAANVIEVERRR